MTTERKNVFYEIFTSTSGSALLSSDRSRASMPSGYAKSTRSAFPCCGCFDISDSAVDDVRGRILQHDVMAAALHDGGGGNDGQLGLLLQFGDGECAAVAHGALDLVQGGLDAVGQRTGVRT